MDIKRWVNIETIYEIKWVHKILTYINKVIDTGKIKRPNQEFYELANSIEIRLHMFPRIIKRINTKSDNIYDEYKKAREKYGNRIESTANKPGNSIRIDNNMKYKFLVDIDSFLFEINACCELIGKFLLNLYNCSGKTIEGKNINEHMRKIIEKENGDIKWFKELDSSRNFFIHLGSPYIAINITNEMKIFPDKPKYDILIKKKIKQNFKNREDFLDVKVLNEICRGFCKSLNIIRKYILEYLENLNQVCKVNKH